MEQKTKKINHLVSDLLTKCAKHNKEINKRFTVCDIFTNLENKTSSDLHAYITESNLRFKKAKIGGNVPSLIKNSSKKLAPLSTQILSNRLYEDFDMDKEKAQLRHKLKHKEAKEITQIMSEVKECTANYTGIEKRFREEMNKNIKEKKTIQTTSTNPILLTSLNYSTEFSKTNNTINDDMKVSGVIKNNNNNSKLCFSSMDLNSYNEMNKEVIKKIFNDDRTKVIDQITSYKKQVTSMGNLLNDNKFDKKEKEKQIENFSTTTSNHLNRKMKMLTYKKPVIIIKPKKKKDEIYTEPIDLNKIVRFIKPSQFELYRKKNQMQLQSPTETNTNQAQSPLLSDRHHSLDTKQVVKNIAYKSFCFGDTMNNKKKAFNVKFNDMYLPKIDEYEHILKDKVKDDKMKRRRYNETNCKCLTEEDTKREILRNKLKDKMTKWNIPLEVLQGI
jgi:hypothetical protein